MGRDPEYLAFAKLVAASLAGQALNPPTVDEERAAHRAALRQISRPPVSTVEELAAGSRSARLYRPAETSTLLVYFHGGGSYLGDVESADPICRRLANATGTAILSVGYRLPPSTRSRRPSTTRTRPPSGPASTPPTWGSTGSAW